MSIPCNELHWFLPFSVAREVKKISLSSLLKNAKQKTGKDRLWMTLSVPASTYIYSATWSSIVDMVAFYGLSTRLELIDQSGQWENGKKKRYTMGSNSFSWNDIIPFVQFKKKTINLKIYLWICSFIIMRPPLQKIIQLMVNLIVPTRNNTLNLIQESYFENNHFLAFSMKW